MISGDSVTVILRKNVGGSIERSIVGLFGRFLGFVVAAGTVCRGRPAEILKNRDWGLIDIVLGLGGMASSGLGPSQWRAFRPDLITDYCAHGVQMCTP